MYCGLVISLFFFVFFFKQKTAYEMRISDWSSDVCSSDLALPAAPGVEAGKADGAQRCDGQPENGNPQAVHVAALGADDGCRDIGDEIGRASCRDRVCQYV